MKRLLLVLAVMALATSAQANLLVNGGFEDDNFGATGWFPGWTQAKFYEANWGTPAPVLDRITGFGIFSPIGAPFEGQYFAGTSYSGHANFHIGLYQTFATVPGQQYVVSGGFLGGVQNSDSDTTWWEVKVEDGTTTDPDAPGTIIAKKERPPSGGEIAFRENFQVVWTATQATSTMFLKWGRVDSAVWCMEAAGFDALSVEVVPEPSSIIALLGGIAGMAGLVIRKKA